MLWGVFTHTAEDAELILDIIAGQDTKDMTTLPDYFHPEKDTPEHLKIGIIEEFMGDGTDDDVRQVVRSYAERLEKSGHKVMNVKLPMAKYSLAIYYIIVPAEITSNLARYDGVRYGLRASDESIAALYGKSRDEGLMPENKRRIMIGSYVLSSGYYDAYYQKAQKARRLLMNEFDELFKSCDLLLCPVAPTPAFGLGENTSGPRQDVPV